MLSKLARDAGVLDRCVRALQEITQGAMDRKRKRLLREAAP